MINYKKVLLIMPLLLALGIVMVLIMKMMVSMETGTIIIALLVPWLGYLLLSGTIQELGFAGVSAKFTLTANTGVPLTDAGNMTPTAHDFDIVGTKGAAAIEDMIHAYKLSDGKPIFLSFILGRKDYDITNASQFIKHLAVYRSFKLVIFLDQFERVIAYMPSWAAQLLLIDTMQWKKFIACINSGKVEELLKYPKIVTTLLTMQSTSIEALRQMNELDLDMLVLVNADHNLKGVVERNEVVSRMMQTLVEKSTIGA